jgi:hypothetical protein
MYFYSVEKRGPLLAIASQIVHNYYALMNTNAISPSKDIQPRTTTIFYYTSNNGIYVASSLPSVLGAISRWCDPFAPLESGSAA